MKNGRYIYENYTIIHLPTFAAANKVVIFFKKPKPFKVLHNGNTYYFRTIDDVLEFINPAPYKAKQIYELFGNI